MSIVFTLLVWIGDGQLTTCSSLLDIAVKLAGRYIGMAVRMAVGLGLHLKLPQAAARAGKEGRQTEVIEADARVCQQVWAACVYAQMSVGVWDGSCAGGEIQLASPEARAETDDYSADMDALLRIHVESFRYGAWSRNVPISKVGGADVGMNRGKEDSVGLGLRHIADGYKHDQLRTLYDHGFGPPNGDSSRDQNEFWKPVTAKLEQLMKTVVGDCRHGSKENDGLGVAVSGDVLEWRELTRTLHCWCTKATLGLCRGQCSGIVEACMHVIKVLTTMLAKDRRLRNVPWPMAHVLFMTSVACVQWLNNAEAEVMRTVRTAIGKILKCLEVLGERWVISKVSALKLQAMAQLVDEAMAIRAGETPSLGSGIGFQRGNGGNRVGPSTPSTNAPDLAVAAEAIGSSNVASREGRMAVTSVTGGRGKTLEQMRWARPPSGIAARHQQLFPSTTNMDFYRPASMQQYPAHNFQLPSEPFLPVSHPSVAYVSNTRLAPSALPPLRLPPYHPPQPYLMATPHQQPVPFPPSQHSTPMIAYPHNARFTPAPQGFRYPLSPRFAGLGPPISGPQPFPIFPKMPQHMPTPNYIPPGQTVYHRPWMGIDILSPLSPHRMDGLMPTNMPDGHLVGAGGKELPISAGSWADAGDFAGVGGELAGPVDFPPSYHPLGPVQ